MKWFSNLKVGAKVFIVCSLFIVLIGVISVQGINSMNNAADGFGVFYAQRFRPVRDLNHMLQNYLQIRIDMISQMLDARENNYADIKKRRDNTDEQVKQYQQKWKDFNSKGLDKEEQKIGDEFMTILKGTVSDREYFYKAIDFKKFAVAEKHLNSWAEGYRAGRDKLKELIEYQEKNAREMRLGQETTARNVFIMSIILLSVSVGFGIIATIVLSRAVSRPVQKGLYFAERIAAGDLTERIDLDQKDELGQLGKALNIAADKLEDLISNVTVSAQNLAQAVEQIASGNENLSQRTSEQASSLEEIASTVEEANATSKQNADNASEANSVSDNSFNLFMASMARLISP